MIHNDRWIRVARCSDIPLREGRSVHVAGREIAIFNLGDRFLAIDNRCPHKQGPLAEGIVASDAVVCPLHAWKINLETGTITRPVAESKCVQAHPVRVIDGIIHVSLSPDSTAHDRHPLACLDENLPASWSARGETTGGLSS